MESFKGIDLNKFRYLDTCFESQSIASKLSNCISGIPRGTLMSPGAHHAYS